MDFFGFYDLGCREFGSSRKRPFNYVDNADSDIFPLASIVFLVFSFTRKEKEATFNDFWTRMMERFPNYLDPARGLLVLIFFPLAIAYLCVAVLKNPIRERKPFTTS